LERGNDKTNIFVVLLQILIQGPVAATQASGYAASDLQAMSQHSAVIDDSDPHPNATAAMDDVLKYLLSEPHSKRNKNKTTLPPEVPNQADATKRKRIRFQIHAGESQSSVVSKTEGTAPAAAATSIPKAAEPTNPSCQTKSSCQMPHVPREVVIVHREVLTSVHESTRCTFLPDGQAQLPVATAITQLSYLTTPSTTNSPSPPPEPKNPPKPSGPEPPLPQPAPFLFSDIDKNTTIAGLVNAQSSLGRTLQKLVGRKTYHAGTIGYERYDFEKNGQGCFSLRVQADHDKWVWARQSPYGKSEPQQRDIEWLLAKMYHSNNVECIRCTHFDDPEAKRRGAKRNLDGFVHQHSFKFFVREVITCMIQQHGRPGSHHEVSITTWSKRGRHRSVYGWIIIREIFLWLGFNVRLVTLHSSGQLHIPEVRFLV